MKAQYLNILGSIERTVLKSSSFCEYLINKQDGSFSVDRCEISSTALADCFGKMSAQQEGNLLHKYCRDGKTERNEKRRGESKWEGLETISTTSASQRELQLVLCRMFSHKIVKQRKSVGR